MFWLIVFVVVVFVIAAVSASGAQQAAAAVQAFAQMAGNEDRFREYWRYAHREMLGSNLARNHEDYIVRNYLQRYLQLCDQFRVVNADNVNTVLPALATQGDHLDIQIASQINPQFGQLMSRKWKRERVQKKYARTVLGLKI